MEQSLLDAKIKTMLESEYLKPDELKFVNFETTRFIKTLADFFGYNDGEPLDEDAVKYVITLLNLKMKNYFGLVDEE